MNGVKGWVTAAVVLLVGIATGPAPAQAACKGGLTAGGAPVVSYDPFEGEVVVTATLDASRNNTSCTPALAITSAAGDGGLGADRVARQGSATLGYSITDPSGQIYRNQQGAALPIVLPSQSQPATQTIRVRVAGGLMAHVGTYTDTLQISLVDLERAGELITPDQGMVNTIAVPVTITVSSKAQVNIAGSSGAFGTFAIAALDFGELQRGTIRNAFVQVRATSGMRITVASANSGALVRLGTSYQSRVPYALRLGGADLPLAAGAQSLHVDQPATVQGSNLPLAVELTGATDGLPAGTYQDVITVDVVPD